MNATKDEKPKNERHPPTKGLVMEMTAIRKIGFHA